MPGTWEQHAEEGRVVSLCPLVPVRWSAGARGLRCVSASTGLPPHSDAETPLCYGAQRPPRGPDDLRSVREASYSSSLPRIPTRKENQGVCEKLSQWQKLLEALESFNYGANVPILDQGGKNIMLTGRPRLEDSLAKLLVCTPSNLNIFVQCPNLLPSVREM